MISPLDRLHDFFKYDLSDLLIRSRFYQLIKCHHV